MTFKWSQFLNVAEELLRSSESSLCKEAYIRTSISRAYYSVYGEAASRLNGIGGRYTVPPMDAHKHVRNAFIEGSTRIQKQIGEELMRLWTQRKKADYKQEDTCNTELARNAINKAKVIQGLLRDPKALKFP